MSRTMPPLNVLRSASPARSQGSDMANRVENLSTSEGLALLKKLCCNNGKGEGLQLDVTGVKTDFSFLDQNCYKKFKADDSSSVASTAATLSPASAKSKSSASSVSSSSALLL